MRSLLSTTPSLLSAADGETHSHDEQMCVLWAPDTPQNVVDAGEDQFAALNGADIDDIDIMRWTSTSTNPGPLGQGDVTTLTWSIMAEGAEIGGTVFGDPTSPSNLRARLDTLYGSSNTWLPLFQQTFDRWEFLSGIDFVFEPNDDGSPLSQVNVGQPGIRGDIRIGGHFIDGNSSILAYNYYPAFGGDMVIDTADNFLDDLTLNSSVLRTIIAHEAGHGVGLRHVTPIPQKTKLMEPNINLNFDGPQHDDVLRIQRGYGDRFERNGGNDTAATTASIGALTAAPVVLGQATITPYDRSDVDDYISIDDDADVDYYRFSLSAATSIDVSVGPVGITYGTGIHGEDPIEIFNSHLQSDLTLAVLAADGTTPLATRNSTGLGGSETVVDLVLPAGQYFIRVTGAQPTSTPRSAQLYKLTASSDVPAAGVINGSLWHDADGDGTRDTGEAALAGWTVFLDSDGDGTLDTGETRTDTTATGAYSLTGLAAGTHTVAIVVQTGWQQTFPAATGGGTGPRTHTVTLTANQQVNDRNFGNRLASAAIKGTLWNDADGDGTRDTGEASQVGWTVFLDTDRDGTLDTSETRTVTTATGAYTFSGLVAGTYTVAIVVQTGWQQTFPAATGGGTGPRTHTVTLTAGETRNDISFGNRLATAAINGLLWDDVDGDGTHDTGEPIQPGWTVFLDTNSNGAPNTGEPSTQTTSTGQYSFTSLTAGTYTVAIVVQAGWEQTFPAATGGGTGPRTHSVPLTAGETVGNINFGNRAALTGEPPAPPVLAAIGNKTMPASQDTLQLNLVATDENHDLLTFSAVAQSIEYQLDQTLGLTSVGGDEYLNWAGRNEKWLTGAGTPKPWFYITPDGKFYRWLGGNVASDPVVEQLSTADYANTALLHNAQPNNAPATLSVNGSTLTINPNDGFLGKFYVAVTVSDGALTDSEQFHVSVQAVATPDTTPPTVTARTPANGATITAASTNIDVTFSEAVQGVDATDLVLSGAGSTGAVKAAPVHLGGNVWRFAVSSLQNGPVNASLGNISDAAGNTMAPTSWSFTVSLQAQPLPPVLSPIGEQTMAGSQDTLQLNLSANDPNNDPLTFSAVAQSLEHHLDQTLGLNTVGGNEYLNWAGRNEKWFTGIGNTWFYITPDGKFYRWLGGNVADDPVVEQLSTAVYANTALLHNAQPNTAPATLAVNGSTLTINPNDGFLGKFYVTATVSDGALTDSEKFLVTVQAVTPPDTTPPTVTARTPANGATITTASTNIDVTLSETVQGVDATDLVLTGSGSTGAVKAAPVHVGGNVWRFAVSNLQNGPVNASLAPDAGDIEDAAGNDLAPTSWSFTVSLQTAQLAPVLSPIGDQSISGSLDTTQLTLSASDPNNDPLTFSAVAQSIEYHLDQTLGLGRVAGNEYFNWGGFNEKWLTGAGNISYYITPDGKLYRWLGGSLANDPLVEQVGTAAYANTGLLHSAQANNAPGSVSVNGSTLTVNPNDTFRGKFVVTVTVSDGQGGTDSETFKVTVT